MRTTSILTVLLAAMIARPAAANNGWWDDVYEQKTVSLEQILKDPVAYRGLEVSFIVQFHRLGTIDNPYYTPFEKERYLNFSAWSDEAALWEKKVYKADFPYMFIDRMAKETAIIVKSRTYDRYLITGRVESIFRGKPWIEVVAFKKLEERMEEPVLIRMVKAFRLKAVRRYDAAASEFAAAVEETLPSHVQAKLHRESGVCLAAAERWGEAVKPLENAVKIQPKDKELQKILVHCKDQAKRAREVKLVKKKKEESEPSGGTEKKD